MYAIPLEGNVRLQTNAALREYARLEYRREDVQWILATARAVRKPRRSIRRFPRILRQAAPAPRPVACKGSPRRSSEGAAVLG